MSVKTSIEMTGPNDESASAMRELLTELFPVHRALAGPGAEQTLEIISRRMDLEVEEVPSGTECFDWIVPKAFKVNQAWVEGPDGSRVIDYADCHYHVWNYSRPFEGVLDRDELKAKIATHPELPDAVPFRFTYYRDDWGLSASARQVEALPPGKYRVCIDTELHDDFLRIGQVKLPGESDREILFTGYICHPLGANDSLSGVVMLVELFRLLSRLPRRRYTYRLALWPEGIGSITYLWRHPERIKRTLGGYVVTCCGDPGPLTYKKSIAGNSVFDRAMLHVLAHSGRPYTTREFGFHRASDEAYLSAPGFRLPMGSLMRTPYGEFPEYHSSADNLDFVTDEALLETLQTYWRAVMVLEANRVYRPKYKTLPFLSRHGVYPYHEGAGDGSLMTPAADAYYHLMGYADGHADLLAIAERTGTPMKFLNRPAEAFLEKGLIEAVDEEEED